MVLFFCCLLFLSGQTEIIRLKNVSTGSLSTTDFVFDTSTDPRIIDDTVGGRDLIFGGNGDDILSGGGGDDTIVGGGGDDRLSGGGDNDILYGGTGNDTFVYRGRGFGQDTIRDFNSSGEKIDVSSLHIADFDTLARFMVQDGPDVVITLFYSGRADIIRLENVSIGSLSAADFVFDTSTADLSIVGTAAQDVLFGAGGNDQLTGGLGADTLIGGGGNDQLMGGSGHDTLIGGTGSDIFIFNPVGFGNDTVTDFNTAGEKLNVAALHIADFDSLQRFISQQGADALINLGGSSIRLQNVSITTLSGVDFIFDTSGAANTVKGGVADDILFGGGGNDTFVYDTRDFGHDTIADLDRPGDRIDLSAFHITGLDVLAPFMRQDGADVVITLGDRESIRIAGVSLASLSAADFVFDTSTTGVHVTGTMYGNILFTNSGGGVLLGSAGDDILIGGAGVDRLEGDTGTDTASYHNSPAGISVDMNTGKGSGGDAEGDTLSVEILIGSQYNDTLIGHLGPNGLQGGNGDDMLRGMGAGDRLDGGAGTDLASYFTSSTGITVDLGAGTASGGDAQGDVLISIENLSGSQGNDTLTGNAGANSLAGNGGNDVLRGGAGADRLDGGAGVDTASYFTGSTGVTVDLAAGTGSGGDAQGDTLIGIENLSGSQVNDTLIGNAGANTLQGWNGDDVLRGGAGADHLDGGAGIDTASWFTSSTGVRVNLATGTAGDGEAQGDTLVSIENVSGSQGHDKLYGSAGTNTLQDWNGNDLLQGGAGRDTLTGGVGADRFVYAAVGDSVVGANADRITDFSRAQGDKIDLSGIDASTGTAGNQAFSFIGSGLYTHQAGQLRYAYNGNDTTIAGDINGDGQSDFHITLTGKIALLAADFAL